MALAHVPTDRGLLHRPVPLWTTLRNQGQEFTARAEYAYDYGMPTWLARVDHTLRPLRLERLFLGRHKFCHFRLWYRDALAPYVKSVLLDPQTLQRPWWQGRRLEEMIRGHTLGTHNHTLEIHKVLTCELIQRQLVERI